MEAGGPGHSSDPPSIPGVQFHGNCSVSFLSGLAYSALGSVADLIFGRAYRGQDAGGSDRTAYMLGTLPDVLFLVKAFFKVLGIEEYIES